MNYELNKYFAKLHKHIVKQQLQIETLQKQLQENIANWKNQNNNSQKYEEENVVNMKDVRNNLEYRQNKLKSQNTNEIVALMGNDKEGYAGLFIKLNQQLHKWIETELDLLKEINKVSQSNNNYDEAQTTIQSEDLEIINNFYTRHLSNKNSERID